MSSADINQLLQSTTEKINHFTEHFKENPQEAASSELEELVQSIKQSNKALSDYKLQSHQSRMLQEKVVTNMQKALHHVQNDTDLQQKAFSLIASLQGPLFNAFQESKNLLVNLKEALKRGEKVEDVGKHEQL